MKPPMLILSIIGPETTGRSPGGSYAKSEYKSVKRHIAPAPARDAALLFRIARDGQTEARRQALERHFLAEAHLARRPSTGGADDATGLLDEALLLDEAAEILLVQANPGERLDGALQLEQREAGRHQL